MVKVGDIEELMESIAPEEMKEAWDNVGLQTGSSDNTVTGILIALDVTSEVIKEAINSDCNMIITHHPLIFEPIRKVTDDTREGKLIAELIRQDINFFCAHTNLDKAEGGVNDCLGEKIGLNDITELDPDGEAVGRIGILPREMTLEEFALTVKEALGCFGVLYYGDPGKKVKTVGLCSGSGSEFYESACKNEADVFLTGEVKYNHYLEGKEKGIAFVEAGHFETENVVLDYLADRLMAEFDIPVYISDDNPAPKSV